MCITFEEIEFVKTQLDYGEEVQHNDEHHSCKKNVPKLLAEKGRGYMNG